MSLWSPRRAFVVLAVLLVFAGACTAATEPSPPPRADLPIVWTQLVDGAAISVRAIVGDGECPTVTVDDRRAADDEATPAPTVDEGESAPMTVRAPAAPPDFPNTVCELTLDADVSEASIGSRDLALGADRPERIATFGDSGCRILDGRQAQACNDPTSWPFPEVAQSAADLEPDLVIHLGDLLGRQAPCPDDEEGCAGSPFGANFTALNADFFSPARPLLSEAPWVFVRGNDERCDADGAGWFRYFAPGPPPPECTDFTSPYSVPLPGANLVVFDSSASSGRNAPAREIRRYRRQFDDVGDLAESRSWFLTHNPMWGIVSVDAAGERRLVRDTRTLQRASQNSLPADFDFVLSGSIRLFELLEFAGGRIPQIISGTGGAELDLPFEESPVGESIAGEEITEARTRRAHGFVVLEREDETWSLSFADVEGARLFTCPFEGGSFTCL